MPVYRLRTTDLGRTVVICQALIAIRDVRTVAGARAASGGAAGELCFTADQDALPTTGETQ